MGHSSMRLRLPTSSRRKDSSSLQFRVRVPADVLSSAKGTILSIALPEVVDDGAIKICVKIGSHIKFSLRTASKSSAKIRHISALHQVLFYFETLKSARELGAIEHIESTFGKEAFPRSIQTVKKPESKILLTIDPVVQTTLTMLFDLWTAETKPSFNTVKYWRSVVRQLTIFLGHENAADIQIEDLVRWKTAMIAAKNVSNRTINDMHLCAIRRLYSFANQNNILAFNPAKDIKAFTKYDSERKMIGYSTDEVFQILNAARTNPNDFERWLTWVIALSGARAGEITQLGSNQITREKGIDVIVIRPSDDGGSVKNSNSCRTVPLHPALIRDGFLDFVSKRIGEPLFYKFRVNGRDQAHPSQRIVARHSSWVRTLGLDHSVKSPNHAFRHWFKSVAVSSGVADSIADAIQGHAPAGEAGRYRHFDIKDLYEAISKIPSLPFP